jgi:hypothetical protein
MKMKGIGGLVCAMAVATLGSGCILALGNRVPEHDAKASPAPTLGKQLTDLKQARDSGAINEEEYQAAKQRLVSGK